MIKYKNSEHKNLIIDCCQDYIVIYNPFNEEIYAKIENEKTLGDNRHACIIYNKDNTDILSVVNFTKYNQDIYIFSENKLLGIMKMDLLFCLISRKNSLLEVIR